MRKLLYLASAASLATALITLPLGGCSSSNGSSPDGGSDGNMSGDTGHKTDGKMPGRDTGGLDSPLNHIDTGMMTDTGTDGPCNFATFVLGLIANDTTAQALPSTNLGQSCTDDMKQSEFASLF
jgi:hypothetical protein